ALLLSLRGSVCIYQGEELGLTEAPSGGLDPYGLTFWPVFTGRDGCRTPMPWTDGDAHCGFSTAEPWLPVYAEHRPLAVAAQEQRPDSVLHAYRRLLRWRRDIPALRLGDIEFIDAPEPVLAFVRGHRGERVVVVLNLGARPVSVTIPALAGMAT